MWSKIAVVVLLLMIVYCLMSGLVFLLRQRYGSQPMAKALTWRIGLSLLLFLLLMGLHFLGWLHPHGITP